MLFNTPCPAGLFFTVLVLQAFLLCGCSEKDALDSIDPADTAKHATEENPPNSGSSDQTHATATDPDHITVRSDADHLTNSIGMSFVRIPAGRFMMGSPPGEPDRHPNEQQHSVQLTSDFFMSVHEVTLGQFAEFAREAEYGTAAETDDQGGYGYDTSGKPIVGRYDRQFNWKQTDFPQTDRHPVTNITWNDANAFAQWLTRKEGVRYRLPTESEWEYACRAGTHAAFYNGAQTNHGEAIGNVADLMLRDSGVRLHRELNKVLPMKDGFIFTAPVGSFHGNAFGLHDMSGNVAEWCSDWFDPNYYNVSPVRNPSGPETGAKRVIRGGGWQGSPQHYRSAHRTGFEPNFRSAFVGFRLVRHDECTVTSEESIASKEPDSETPPEMVAAADAETTSPEEPASNEVQTPVKPASASEVFDFQPLALDFPATSMSMTEDGRWLVVTHQADGQITFHDVVSNATVTTRSATQPRCVLCRGDYAFVSCHGEGTINVYSRQADWKLVNELRVMKPGIVHLSAAGAADFDGTILVTCHGEGIEASYRNSHVYAVNLKTDRCRLLGQPALASVSYDGKLIVTQDSFNLSPSGRLTGYNFTDYMAGTEGRQPVFRGGSSESRLYQVYRGGFWIGSNVVYGGIPIVPLKDKLGRMVVPDVRQRMLYAVSEDIVQAHKLNSTVSELGWRRATFPNDFADFSRVYHHLYRTRDYYLDHPVAATHGDRLIMFLLTAKGAAILRAEGRAFEEVNNSNSDRMVDAPIVRNPPPTDQDTPSSEIEEQDIFETMPHMIAAAQPFHFQFDLPPETTVDLMSELPEMTLSKDGVLRWVPSSEMVGVHELKFQVTRDGRRTFERPKIEVIDEELAKSVDGNFEKLRDFRRLDLEPDHFSICLDHDGRNHLLVQGDQLTVIGPDGITAKQKLTLPHRYELLKARPDVFVGVTTVPSPQMHVIDRRTMRVRRRIELNGSTLKIRKITDIAVHPHRSVSYVAVNHDVNLPRYTVLAVDESTGTVDVPGIFGTWVAVHPDGSQLYTGYRDIYQQGSTFHLNPGWRLIEIPDYGSVDMLLAWDTDDYELTDAVRRAGGNGSGIRLSADGRRITYLSHTGVLPQKTLRGWDTEDFRTGAVDYQVKDIGVTKELAWHPILPWAAVPGSGSAVLFHRETGERLDNRLLLTADGVGTAKVERLFFSADGQHLVLVCSEPGSGRWLRNVLLKQTAAERATKAPEVAPRHAETLNVRVPRRDIHSLEQPTQTTPLTPKEIGRRYLDAIVEVKHGRQSGTGFLIGESGYVLTAAHVVGRSRSGNVTVVYSVSSEALEPRPREATAQVIRIDKAEDLALLKFTSPQRLTHVVLAGSTPVETGESVTVIGNPGLGDDVLERTMTTGIVSSPDRELDGIRYLQTSAPVNPGNSGGPMFNSHGHVIGMVTLKASLEGTAFAIPADKLRDFLNQAVE